MILLSIRIYAQQNLVPNGSFEEITQCPTGSNQITHASPWINDVGGCELFHTCVPVAAGVNAPNSAVGLQAPRTGFGYAGIFTYGGPFEENGREYLQVHLNEPILGNIDYLVSFWTSPADNYQYAISSLGAYLSDTLVTRTEFNSILNVEPSIENHYDSILDNKDIWHHVTDTFRSRYGGEQYLLIGNFRTAEESNLFFVDSGAGPNWDRSYYYIDDVSVVAIDSVPSSVEDMEIEQNTFSVYPNPNNGRMTVSYGLSEGEAGTLTIYSALGQLVFQHQLNEASNQMELNLSNVNSGIYLLTLEVNGENRLTERLSIFKE